MYQLYVIELRKTVFSENKKFRDANPQFNGVLECVYVGMTSKSPKDRFDQHKNGVLSKKGQDISATIVKKYGIFLRPSLYAHIQSFALMEDALKAEKELALKLKRQRYAVWVN
ncbi:MAG: ribose-5-phosphate isomerase [Saprospiraceae bacterium]|nr:ribose-5-phosphate isomerase [Saprospiraceae bacterium]MBK8668872.1 ribose-5-phosphate isomerase [Saprospiraceae bacterium]